ncbi:hypothetical protein NEFER03_0187 [Nematocida sp. LUAm3]|nr:hypothetical protein NEFER03_0187 [Nematocida sp. LUAm3]KAI5173640.1 hypothetical protein NEFER02_0156 [Nematocida sp. LUAm2]KAI5176861.1 hypothetical protein NEFER01_0186 [Nematocida sp. LUAm1]
MEYFRRIDVDQISNLEKQEKEDCAQKIVSILGKQINQIFMHNELLVKFEYFIPHMCASTLSEAISHLEVDDIFNGKRAFLMEKFLVHSRELETYFSSEEKPVISEFIKKIEDILIDKIEKGLRSKGTNHIIRELLSYKEVNPELLSAIETVSLLSILEDPTKTSTYIKYLEVLQKEKKKQTIYRLIDLLEVNMLKSHQSYLYQKACELASYDQKASIFQKIEDSLLSISLDPIGNYFVQTLILTYDVESIFKSLQENLSQFQRNSNVLYHMCVQACKEKKTHIVDHLLSTVFPVDSLMQRSIYNENGGFDSKGYKLASALLSVQSKALSSFQLEAISLYEKYWLFHPIGQKIIVSLLRQPLDQEILSVFLGTLSKELLGIAKTKEGHLLLSSIERVSSLPIREKIRTIRKIKKREETVKK